MRFLPNPYYIEELRPMSGNDKEVRDYVMDNETARIFLNKLTDMVEFFNSELYQRRKDAAYHRNRMYRWKAQIRDIGE